MRIIIANVNTTQRMTDAIVLQARSVAASSTEIIGITPQFGPESVECSYESHIAAVSVMEAIRAYDQPFDAIIQAGYGEQGREGLQELFDVPVVDITEAAAVTALFVGRTYSVVTTLDRTVPMIEDRLKLAGLSDRCASVHASGLSVLELEQDVEATTQAIVRKARYAVEVDNSEAICLGCGGMAGLAEQVAAETGVPVIDGVSAAVAIAEGLVRQGLATSKIRSSAAPRPKSFLNWPPRL